MFTDKLYTSQREITGLGIYHYGARFYSPKLGRFLSADTIVPNPANPQAFNRYAYVLNNPTRYVDPTGHVCSDPEDETPTCYGSSRVQTLVGTRMIRGNDAELRASRIRPRRGGGSPAPDPIVGVPITPVVPPGECSGSTCPIVTVVPPGLSSGEPVVSVTTSVSSQTSPSFVENYCGDISTLACGGMLAQDAATLIDLVGVGLIEGPAVAVGCLEGGALGCAIAEVGVIYTWTITLNNAETYASGTSFVLTLGDDLLNNGGWGENSSTSLVTLAAGQLPLPPSWDLVVDTYASGYNHGLFNGIHTIWRDGLVR